MDVAIIDLVRRFGVFLAGWLLGAAVIVALGEPRRVGHVGSALRSSPAGARQEPLREAGLRSAAAAPLHAKTEGLTPAASLVFARSEGLAPRRLVPVLGVAPGDLRDSFAEPRGGGRVHRAMDILAPTGTPVVASVDGTIRKLFTSAGGGLSIYQYDREGALLYYYAHLDRYADGLAEGNFVKQGSVIGYVGTTGNAPAGTPHLHFSIEVLPPSKEWWKGEPVNPYPLLTR